MTLGLILVFFAAFAAFTWRRLEYGVVAIAAALPLYVVRFHVFGLPSTLLEGMLLTLFFIWIIQNRKKLREIMQNFFAQKFLTVGICMFFLASIISIFIAPDHIAALGLWRAYIFEPLLFFFVCIDTIHTKRQILTVCSASILSAGSIALYAIFQKIAGFGIPEPWTLERRVTSIYPYPNAIGLYLAPIVMIGIALLVWRLTVVIPTIRQLVEGIHKIKNYSICTVLCSALITLLLAIFFAKTEAALVALAISGIWFGFFWSKKSRRAAVALCIFLLFAMSISPPLQKTLQEKFFLNDWSGTVRKLIWKESIPMIQDHWIVGAGFSGYPERMRDYHKAEFIEIFQYPHNIILNIWSEMGIMGLVAFEMLIGWFFYILIRSLRILRNVPHGDERDFIRALAFGCFFAMMTIVIHGLVDVPYFKNDLAVFFWILMGLAVVVCTRTKELNQECT